jgi:hypothetical protein
VHRRFAVPTITLQRCFYASGMVQRSMMAALNLVEDVTEEKQLGRGERKCHWFKYD